MPPTRAKAIVIDGSTVTPSLAWTANSPRMLRAISTTKVRHATAKPPPPADPGQQVEILRGDLFEKRDFAKERSKP